MKSQISNLQKAVRSYTKRQHLASLGDVGPDDAHQPVKGFMQLADHSDSEFSSGHVHGIDVLLVVRSVNLPGKKEPITRLIVEYELPFNFPHVVALGGQHEEAHVKSLLAGYHHYQRFDTANWRVFTHAQSIPHLPQMQAMLEALSDHQISDVEFESSKLRIYYESLQDSGELDAMFDFIKESVAYSQA